MILASAVCLVVSQFVDYRAIEIGQPGYAGLPGGRGTADGRRRRRPAQAHSYLLVPIALLAAVVGVLALRPGRRGLGRVVVALGLLSLAVILLVDLPAGLDAGAAVLALRRARPRCSRTASTPSSRQRRGWSLADCSTMRGRAEYESTCPQGPQAP